MRPDGKFVDEFVRESAAEPHPGGGLVEYWSGNGVEEEKDGEEKRGVGDEVRVCGEGFGPVSLSTVSLEDILDRSGVWACVCGSGSGSGCGGGGVGEASRVCIKMWRR